jgi:hypothetical protein
MSAVADLSFDPFKVHPVMLALSKARAMASVLAQLAETEPTISNNLVNALRDGSHPEETLGWLQSVVSDALRAALDEVETDFRNTLTVEQAREQVLGGPKAVA